jgi:hypothetical protein
MFHIHILFLFQQQIEGLKQKQHIMEQVTDEWPSSVNAIEKRVDGIITANSDFRKGGTVDGIE